MIRCRFTGEVGIGMPQTRLALTACILTLCAGCVSYAPSPLSPASQAEALETRSLEDPRLQAFVAAASAQGSSESRKPWDLGTLTLAALYYHPDLDVARARLGTAQAGVRAAQALPNPSLSFEDLAFATNPTAWTVAPIINFLIETAGKREHRTREARAEVEAAREELMVQSWTVRAGVRAALLEVWGGQRRLVLLRQVLDLQQSLTTLLEHRFNVGEASALDVARERTRLNQARLGVVDAAGRIDAARARLAGAIGIGVHALSSIELETGVFDEPPRPQLASGELRRQALTGRSDVQGLLAQYAAAESAFALEVANQYPNVTLSPGYSFDSVQNRYLIEVALELPVFNQNRGPLAVAAARREEAAARFTALQSHIINLIDTATVDYESASGTVATAMSLLEGEVARERQASRSFEAGMIDRPAWLTVQLEQLAAAQTLLDTQVQQRTALGSLEDALQHPFFGPALPGQLETPPRDHTGT
jgi:outer membrane protein TolC